MPLFFSNSIQNEI